MCVDIADFHHLVPKNHLRGSQSNEMTRIFPPSLRLSASVVLSVVPRRSSTFSTFSSAMHQDDALDFLIERLAATPDHIGRSGSSNRLGSYGCDLWIPQTVQAYWQSRLQTFSMDELGDEHFQPFYDAAWELARPPHKVERQGRPRRGGETCFGRAIAQRNQTEKIHLGH
jgi:hypothetical protein